MIISSPKKNKKGILVLLALTLTLFFSVGSVYAASVRANIFPGKTEASSSSIKATASNGTLSVESQGPNYYAQGYAKKEISYWPDSTAASLTANAGQNRSTNFSASKGSRYYVSVYAQPGSGGVYGEAIIKF